ncbi:hypothetical protein MPL3356_70216 [Mesorhizobium plurifarium]|uniref:Uncharacterized protein n=1 Tax=Mesorhizobium plurifarium TaxID=69974 RepID=A0A090ECA4_MESPL|nr:hypothetical protein MPL3356_70216 [Mesorhizobium plurifarium]
MQQATYRYLHDFFSTLEYSPSGSASRALTEHALAGQLDHYRRLVSSIFSNAAKQKIRRISDSRSMLQVCMSYVNSIFEKNPLSISGIEGEFVLSGVIPVISSPPGDTFPKEVEESFTDDLNFCFPAALFFELSRAGVKPNNGNPLPPELDRESASYAAWRAIDSSSDDPSSFVAARNNIIEKQAKELADKIDEALADINKRTTEHAGSLDTHLRTLSERTDTALKSTEDAIVRAASFESQILDLTKKADGLDAAIDAKTADADDKISGFLASAKARSTYENLKIHWVNRSRTARSAMFASWIFLGILLILIPCFAVYENESIVALITRIANAANITLPTDAGPIALTIATFSRLIIVTIPLALYFWLIRLVVRFNMRSMLLMDDANVRATIIETYYKMIEERAATIEDRALILTALCRPPPGHGGDSVDPPNFTELVDKAMGK